MANASTYVYSNDWWEGDDGEEIRVRIVLDEGRLGRLVYKALHNDSGRAQAGPFRAQIIERRPAKQGAMS